MRGILLVLFCGSLSAAELPPPRLSIDPFRTVDGRLIRTPDEWMKIRRPELKALFQDYVYGRLPPSPGIEIGEIRESLAANGTIRLRQVPIKIKGTKTVINLAVFMPLGKGKVALFLSSNKCGNQAVHPELAIGVKRAWTAPICQERGWDRRGATAHFWVVEKIVAAGYGFATFHEGDVEPDREGGEGIRKQIPSSWGAVAAWAWGYQRALDYLESEPGVDAARVIVIGHSRRGKAALLAAALDERIAMAVPHQSGTGGMALSRGNRMETVARITKSYPHWFAPIFKEFADDPERLPVDQDLLVALISPRPVLDTEGSFDLWASPDSALESLRRADAVYRFLGVPGLAPGGNLSQVRLRTFHTLNEKYWDEIIRFTNQRFRGSDPKVPGSARSFSP